ncbi:putative carboxylesterase [Tothia fuscella]|uniref:Carboxylic ester hydrolase n=1 Tax=Tothia fuscella TaxID=1048955 RepID=A0A9P4NPN8_9PEZI|nr:putative carboxylesterase [Tothia fuscella]
MLLSIVLYLSFGVTVLARASLPRAQFRVRLSGQTTGGIIQGHASKWQPEVSEYLGIPFAQPPIGDLRFAAPKPNTFNGTLIASEFGSSCPSNLAPSADTSINYESFPKTLLSLLGQAGDKYDEDCLTLNIWSKPQVGEKAKAVLLWIYGGGFGSGNTRNPSYNGARLANDNDVVVVSINYRVNIYGFPRAPFLPDLNLGLLDQRLAVEWVRDNIAAFGGDPKRITLFGQSAGGASVDYYTFAWTKDPIAAGYIPESGTAANTGAPLTNASASWYGVTQKLGCGGAEAGESTLVCMRKQKWQDITNAIEKRGVTPNMGAGGFGPTTDEKIVFSDYSRRRAEGNFIKAPMLVGSAGNENGFYQLLAKSRNATAVPGSAPAAAPSFNANIIGCGASPAATARRTHGVNAWRYVYAGEWPNQDIGIPGSWHGSEIGFIFGSTEYSSRRPDTPEEVNMSEKIRAAWTGFAKDPVNGLGKLGWPLYDASAATVVRIGGPNSSEIAFEKKEKFDRICSSL